MSPDHQRLPLLGGYAMAPRDPREAAALDDALAELPIGGLELPAPGEQPADRDAVSRLLQPDWQLMLTCIPLVMQHRAAEPAHGLASTDEEGRARALNDVERAVGLARDLADRHGTPRVTAIEVHSAPGPGHGSVDALARSLATIADWDLAGAQIVLEHCDALVRGQDPAKGFLDLDDEIAAIHAAGDPETIDLGINWGRSAIEGRSPRTPLEHLRIAREAQLLRAVVLSGATDRVTAWGDAWSDAHITPRGDDPALAASAASLLGPQEISAALGAAGDGPLLALKVSVRPPDASVAHRVAVARAALAQMEASRVL